MSKDPKAKNLFPVAQGFIAFTIPFLLLTEGFILLHSQTTKYPYHFNAVIIWSLFRLITFKFMTTWMVLGLISGLVWMNKGTKKAILFIISALLIALWVYGLLARFTMWLDWGLF